MTSKCDLCQDVVETLWYSLIIDVPAEDSEQYDFCSWRCLKHWVADE
jgi:hypothetical protein